MPGLDFSQASSLLSIGPVTGWIDSYIITNLFPDLKCYIAVERDTNLLKELHANIGKLCPERPFLQTHLYHCDVEQWECPGKQVDVILLSTVLYYLDDPEKILKRCQSWLAPGGCLWIIQADTEELYKNMKDHMDISNDRTSMRPVSADQIVHDMNFKSVKYFEFPESVNFSSITKDVVNFCLDREATQNEVESFKTMIKVAFEDSHFICKTTLQIHLCTK